MSRLTTKQRRARRGRGAIGPELALRAMRDLLVFARALGMDVPKWQAPALRSGAGGERP